MKLRVGSIKAFVKELKEKKIDEVRIATLYSNIQAKDGKHTIPMLNSITVATALLNSNMVLVYEQSNGTVYNFPDDRKEISERSGNTEKSITKELKKCGFSAKEGIFEL